MNRISAQRLIGAALLAGDLISSADATVYDVNRTIGLGGVVGTITTDGATGQIGPSDITGWDLWLNGDGASFHITNLDSGAVVWGGGDLSADAAHVYFDFGGGDGGFVVFQDGYGSGTRYWCLDAGGSACIGSESVVPQSYTDASAQFAHGLSGNQIVANAAVPEPAAWAMTLAGFGAVAVVGYYRRRGPAMSARLGHPGQ